VPAGMARSPLIQRQAETTEGREGGWAERSDGGLGESYDDDGSGLPFIGSAKRLW